MIGPKGKFLLEPDDDRAHLFVSSGTGNAPFVSMMRDALGAGRPRRAIFLNGVSHERDLGYRELVEGWEASGEYPVTFVPTVSRPDDPSNAGWTGRTGRVETIVAPVINEFGLDPADTIAYLCGNPDMILSAEQTLLELGLPEEAVKKELYWPKGKEPRGRRVRTWPRPSMPPRRTPTSRSRCSVDVVEVAGCTAGHGAGSMLSVGGGQWWTSTPTT